MTTASAIGGAPPPPNPNTFKGHAQVGMPPGTPVGISPSDLTKYAPAGADTGDNPNVFGLLASACGADGPCVIQYAGPLSLTDAQWKDLQRNVHDLDPDSLQPGEIYYLSTISGQISRNAPVGHGQTVVPLGYALPDGLTLFLQIAPQNRELIP